MLMTWDVVTQASQSESGAPSCISNGRGPQLSLIQSIHLTFSLSQHSYGLINNPFTFLIGETRAAVQKKNKVIIDIQRVIKK